VLLGRIENRTANPYGKKAEERKLILEHPAEVEPLLRATCTHEIDAHPRATMLIAQKTHLTAVLLETHQIDLALVEQGYLTALQGERINHEQTVERIRQTHKLGLEIARRIARDEPAYPGLPRGADPDLGVACACARARVRELPPQRRARGAAGVAGRPGRGRERETSGLCQLRDLVITAPEPLRSELRRLGRARLLRRLVAGRPHRHHDAELQGTLLALRALARPIQQLTLEERELA
jgi:hypothetical protein